MAARFMWIFVIGYGLLGIAGVLAPTLERRLIGVFTRKMPVRLLGVVLIVLGVLVFRWAPDTGWPRLAQVLGVVNTIAGGVNLILPDAMVVFNENWIASKTLWHRLLGVLYLVAAYLCYLATIITSAASPDA
ncbi:MAG TPA: hypothetical protein PKY35_04820 [Candidatus Hydrogenedentes bacterium]|nr:hypothetical protein [Candidatus Hydrogenedentota bacterium]HOL76332.1 hypothetical protein [Candidatus Hydrogenedentota bacterium]HPO86160.1 hypothetical protein [Candidatus Hydrogenedentota bacterium]